MRRCSSNTDDLLKPGSVFEHRLWCHGASSLGMMREVKMRRGREREIFEEKFFGEVKCNKGSSNSHNYTEMDGTMHWSKGPLRQLIYETAIESWMMSFENK